MQLSFRLAHDKNSLPQEVRERFEKSKGLDIWLPEAKHLDPFHLAPLSADDRLSFAATSPPPTRKSPAPSPSRESSPPLPDMAVPSDLVTPIPPDSAPIAVDPVSEPEIRSRPTSQQKRNFDSPYSSSSVSSPPPSPPSKKIKPNSLTEEKLTALLQTVLAPLTARLDSLEDKSRAPNQTICTEQRRQDDSLPVEDPTVEDYEQTHQFEEAEEEAEQQEGSLEDHSYSTENLQEASDPSDYDPHHLEEGYPSEMRPAPPCSIRSLSSLSHISTFENTFFWPEECTFDEDNA